MNRFDFTFREESALKNIRAPAKRGNTYSNQGKEINNQVEAVCDGLSEIISAVKGCGNEQAKAAFLVGRFNRPKIPT